MAASPGGCRVIIFIFCSGNNLVKYTDPDGETPVTPNTRMGQKAHNLFED
jgi:hypothetical protein